MKEYFNPKNEKLFVNSIKMELLGSITIFRKKHGLEVNYYSIYVPERPA